jgi:hypothetical protein
MPRLYLADARSYTCALSSTSLIAITKNGMERVIRVAWPVEKVLNYIRSLAGSHFDPQVVKVCLESGLLVTK